MKKNIFLVIIAVLLLLCLPMSSLAADEELELIAYYDFDGDFNDELNSSELTLIDVIESGDSTFGNATSSFGNDTGEGDTSYWQWTSVGSHGGGFCIDVDDLDILENYSIGVRFVYDDICEGSSWDKIIDYQNRGSDRGFYFYNGVLQFYPNVAGDGTTVFSAGDVLDIIVTRDAETGEFIAYTVEDGTRVKEIEYDDLVSRDAIPAQVNDKVRFGFFHDDSQTSAEATSGGKVYSVKIWNGPITAEQATQAMETPNTLSFNANGATSGTAPSDIMANEGDSVTIPGNTGSLTKAGMHVAMWNTLNDGNGDDYAFASTYTMTAEDEELFAKWAINTYAVRFNANGGEGTMSDQNFTYNVAQDLSANIFTLDGHIFEGWAIESDGTVEYSDTENVNNLSDDNDAVVQLYAVWNELKLASSVSSGIISVGESIVLTPNIDGGEWDWDEEYFSATFNSPATFSAQKAGTSVITYTVADASTTYLVTVNEFGTPSTGQNNTLIVILVILAVLALAAGIVLGIWKRKK